MSKEKKIKCPCCDRVFSELKYLSTHLKKKHSWTEEQLSDYAKNNLIQDIKCSKDGCDHLVEVSNIKGLKITYRKTCSYCSYKTLICPECNKKLTTNSIRAHLINEHKYDEDKLLSYYKKYVFEEKDYTCSVEGCGEHTDISENKNPYDTINLKFRKYCNKHDVTRIPTNKIEHWLILGYSIEDATDKVEWVNSRVRESLNKIKLENPEYLRQSNNTCIEYWLDKTNGDLDKAKQLLKNRQTTFSKKKCIEKYGEDEGERVWKERQDKWKYTMDNKPEEEKQRILISKMHNFSGRSTIQLELCDNIKETILDLEYFNENEYFISKKDIGFFKYDIVYGKNIIEFQGDFWHCNPKKYTEDYIHPILNKTAKEIWEYDYLKKDIAINEGFNLLYIWEHEYREDKNKITRRCIDFLLS